MIAILDFVFDEGDEKKYRYDIKLTDIGTCKVFYDKLMFIYLELPKFRKRLEEVSSHFEKWLYVLRHLGKLEGKLPVLQEEVFEKLFRVAELAKLSAEQAVNY